MTITGDRDYISIPIVTINDMSADDKLGRAVTHLGEFADSGDEALGVCMQQAESGQTMQVGIWGVLKYRPQNVISVGYKVTVTTSGFFIAAAANTTFVGVALGQSGVDAANTSSGALATAMLNFAARSYIMTISGGALSA